ncbi:TonB-dependent receptor domain-containing protein [Hydrogenophaga sp. UC242_53]|uniref:TonB-dependent receptor n=1 Tax=Hydrogenophaga sp. UC242_53 TaxID=3350170 RepID=UPI0036D332A4
MRKPYPALVPMALAAALATGLCGPAIAQTAETQVHQISIAAQALGPALNELARQSGLQLLFPPELVAGKTALAVSGRFTTRQALDQLLAGSGLVARREGGAVMVRRAPQAASPTPAGDAAVELSTVTVLGSAPLDQGHAATTHTLQREDLERFPATSPGDLFKDIPGVTVANSRNGSSLDINIRGMQGFGRVKILVDGTESSGSTYKGYAGETTQSYVDPELLGEIKVEKGPNAGPYGAGVVGGVVSMSTLTADDLIGSGKAFGLRLRGTAVNHSSGTDTYSVLGPPASGSSDPADAITRDVSVPGRAWNGSLAGAWRLLDDKLEIVAGLSHRQSGNYVSGRRGDVTSRPVNLANTVRRVSLYEPGQTVYNTSQDTDSQLLKASLKLPGQQKVSVGYSRLQSEFGEARSAAFIDYITQLNLSSVDSELYTAQYAWTPAGNPWIDLRVNLWSAHSKGYQAADFRSPGLLHNATWTDTRGQGLEAWNTSVLGLPAGGDLTLKYGLTWLSEKAEVTPLDGGIYMDPGGDRSLNSTFVQADLQPVSWLLLNAGLRRERYEVKGDAEVSSGIPGQVVPLKIAHRQSRTNGSLGVTLQPRESLQFFARYSEGWRPPTAKETINSLIAASNPDRTMLKPEFTQNTEAGVRFELQDLWWPKDRFHAGLTFFDIATKDYIYGSAGEFRNADEARFRGKEFNLGYDSGAFFARYGLTRYDRVSFCDAGGTTAAPCIRMPHLFANDPSFVGYYVPPRSQESLTLGTRLLDRRLTLGLRMTGAKAYSKDGALVSGWDSYQIYDLFGSWRINKHLNVAFSVENLRDRFYMEASTSYLLAIPSPGRTAKATLTYTF